MRALLALRISGFALLALLLVNPRLPGEDPAAARGAPPSFWLLVDPDPALAAVDREGRSLWAHALERSRGAAEVGARIARVSGGGAEGLDPATLEGQRPGSHAERPDEALVRLAEAGADSLLLLSPLRRPSAALEAALARIPVPVRVERIGEEVRNAAVAELDLPARAPSGEPLEGSVLLVGEGGAPGDSVRLVVAADGQVVVERFVPLPATGAPARVDLELPPPPGTGEVRYTASVELEGDGFAADDARVRVVRVGPPEGGVVVVSFRPDWEPRTILPVLERATGLDGEGFLRMADGRFLPLVAGGAPLTPVGAEELAERTGSASLLVVHGVAEPLQAGPLAEAVQRHPRTLHLPAGPAGAALAGVPVGPARTGEWTPDGQIPPSPVAGFLAGRSLAGLPPLTSVLVPDAPAPGAARPGTPALALRRPGAGSPVSGLLLADAPEGRRAVALATGFWRWGAREGEAREAYRSLWAGVAGWLLAHDAAVGGPGVIRPEDPVLERDRPVAWQAPGLAGVRVEVEVRAEDADPDGPHLRRDEATVGPDGRFTLPELPPGRYRYRARVLDASGTAPEPATGAFEVEAFQDALLRPPGDPEALTRIAGTEAVDALRADAGRPLRTHPLPWLLLLGLLCVEWIGRRRKGLQ